METDDILEFEMECIYEEMQLDESYKAQLLIERESNFKAMVERLIGEIPNG